MWDPKNGKQQWWIDAFTCDPRALGQAMAGIQFKGDPIPVAQNDVLNAAVGRLPVMLVYIAVHEQFGTRIFYPYHGAKCGKKAAYEDYEYWTRDLTAAEVAHLNDFLYYNQPGARNSARNAGCKVGAAFDTAYFRVRSHMQSACLTALTAALQFPEGLPHAVSHTLISGSCKSAHSCAFLRSPLIVYSRVSCSLPHTSIACSSPSGDCTSTSSTESPCLLPVNSPVRSALPCLPSDSSGTSAYTVAVGMAFCSIFTSVRTPLLGL